MNTQQLKQLGIIIAIIVIAAILLPFITGLISLLIKLVLFAAIVFGLYWVYQTYLKK
ncbi:hypothetical protein [Lacticaseibacillus parakribbianus]|uniref:hypothetical protein n=1 Tax=Lacticaseibacillus parakribbianus TaxID=2970927 RepID=UPI0021CB5D7F|nr:hypothetical protein [Lacticaseibacillus parakribbianus]